MSSISQYKIGIGVTTYNRPKMVSECLYNISKHTDMSNVKLCVATDTDQDRKGVAYQKNKCLRALKDCDYIFLFDDDCYPIKDGWVEFFINSGHNHLLFLNDKLHTCYMGYKNISYYRDCGGVFMFITKGVVDKVGAFNEKFTPYGFEHAEYSIRILGKHGQYPMLKGTEEYLFAHDYSTKNHKSSISTEEKNIHIKNNWHKFFNNEFKTIYLPL